MSSSIFDITSISLIVSIVSLVITFGLVVFVVRARTELEKDNGGRSIDALAIVQEFRERNRAFEEKLVDLRIRLEILDLRVEKLTSGAFKRVSSNYESSLKKDESITRPSFSSVILPRTENTRIEIDPIRHQILTAVKEANGRATSREIQQKVGRSREHVARTMNQLQKQGLLNRNQDTRPFSYSITEEGENELGRAD